MGRRSRVDSERAIMKQLAEERKVSRPLDIAERNEKILKMVKMGCDYADVGKRYGLSAQSVARIIYKYFPGQGVRPRFGNNNMLELARYVDGIG